MRLLRLRRAVGARLSRWFPPAAPATRESEIERYRRLGARIGEGTRLIGRLDGVNPHLIRIGRHCVLGAASAVLSHCPLKGAQAVEIGDHVWIGYGALVLPGVEIGSGSVIGAGSVVTRSVPERSVVAGSPARVLRTLGADEAARLARDLESGRALGSDTGAERHALVGPGHLWQQKREFQIDFLRRAGLAPHHRLLDLGCGTLRGGVPLIAYLEPGHYTGIEVRAEVLDEGRRELAEAGLESRRPDLRVCADLSRVELVTRFDFVWAFSVLIHMEDAVAAQALDFVARHLTPAGTLFANVNLGSAPRRCWQGFPVVTRHQAFYEELASRVGLRVESYGPLRDLGHVSGDAAADAQSMLRFTPK